MATTDNSLLALTPFTALGSALMAGVFFAFSTFVMKAPARLPAGEGNAAMQAINVAAPNPWFLTVFFGTAVASALAVVSRHWWRWSEPGAVLTLVGGTLYRVGGFLVTVVFNASKNNALATLTPNEPSQRETVDRLRGKLDGLEPRSDGGIPRVD